MRRVQRRTQTLRDDVQVQKKKTVDKMRKRGIMKENEICRLSKQEQENEDEKRINDYLISSGGDKANKRKMM